jgi:hypothetical protein
MSTGTFDAIDKRSRDVQAFGPTALARLPAACAFPLDGPSSQLIYPLRAHPAVFDLTEMMYRVYLAVPARKTRETLYQSGKPSRLRLSHGNAT